MQNDDPHHANDDLIMFQKKKNITLEKCIYYVYSFLKIFDIRRVICNFVNLCRLPSDVRLLLLCLDFRAFFYSSCD